jgi:hypothetical protein
MTAPTPADVPGQGEVEKVVAGVLRNEGCEPGSSIHSWRCEHPDHYGPCTCVEEVAAEVAKALAKRDAEVARRAKVEALREAQQVIAGEDTIEWARTARTSYIGLPTAIEAIDWLIEEAEEPQP